MKSTKGIYCQHKLFVSSRATTAGITLVALVVTVVVLLILAGITIMYVMGDNGVFGKASKAKEQTEIAKYKEMLETAKSSIIIDGLGTFDPEAYFEYIEKQGIIESKDRSIIDNGDGTYEVTTELGYVFLVTLKPDKENSRDAEIECFMQTGKLDPNIKIEIVSNYTADYVKGSLNIKVTYGEKISEIIIKKGKIQENLEIGQAVDSVYTINKEILENGNYTIIAKNSEGNYNKKNESVTNITENLEIWNKEDMEKFRDEVSNGRTFEGKTVKLMDNIDLNGNSTNQWDGEGKNLWFKGTFDGNYKTISGLFTDDTKMPIGKVNGLFKSLGANGVIKNLTVKGELRSSAMASGGIVGTNQGKIENCANYCVISGTHNVGGIAGVSNGIISNCCNKGAIYGSEWGIGGITGYNGNVDQPVGIVGKGTDIGKKVGYIFNCYNNASVTCAAGRESYCGGVVGRNNYYRDVANISNGYVYNVYSINKGNVFGSNTGGVVQNSYTTDANAKVGELNSGIDEMEQIYEANGISTANPWVADTQNINNGYPILEWEDN